MGTCCAAPAAKPAAKAKNVKLTGNLNTPAGPEYFEKVKSNIDSLITQDIRDLFVISVPKQEFGAFIKHQLAPLLEFMLQKTKKVYVPMKVGPSIVMPETEVFVTLRDSANVKHFSLDRWFVRDPKTLSAKFVTRTVNFKSQASDLDAISDLIKQQLEEFHSVEGLHLIGGFQESNTTYTLFFYKNAADKAPQGLFLHNMACAQWGDSDEQRTQIEQTINDMHLDSDGTLRCILTVIPQGSENQSHMLVFLAQEGNKMYHVNNWPEWLQDQLDEDIDEKKLTKLDYDQQVTLALNSVEMLIGGQTALASLMINADFSSSYIMTASLD